MSEHLLDIGAILRQHQDQLLAAGGLRSEQRRALRDLSACRTAALGGRLLGCPCCGECEYVYHSCRNRHCPRCQAGSRARWLQREAGWLLAVEYHHVVFTLPQALVDLACAQPRLVYGLLFEAASAAVAEMAADPKHLGARVGLVAVLHTWGQQLGLHPHLHVLATGGGLSCNARGEVDETPCWRSARPGFFLPVRALSRLFRGKYLAGLRRAYAEGRLPRPWAEAEGFTRLQKELHAQEWVVYSQPPCAGPEVVLKYLARYVHRVAISNSRLVRVGEEGVTFSYKDYRQGGRQKEMTLSGLEFSRRLLQHVLPGGFVRVRHYGLLANRGREERLRQCRCLLLGEPLRGQAGVQASGEVEEQAVPRCPHCGVGVMVVLAVVEPSGQGKQLDTS